MSKTTILRNGVQRTVNTTDDINYIDNYDASSLTGWTTYNDAAETVDDSIPFNGTAGTANITLTRNTSSPLRKADFLITKDAVNRQGQGVSYDFTIDRADQAKQLIITLDKKPSANYVTGDIRVYVYDVTNSTIIRVESGEDIGSEEGVHYARFQTSSNSTSYRLILHVASTSALAYTMNFVNIQVGPKAIVYGSPITDMKADTGFTSSLTGTISAKSRRVGDSKEVELSFAYSSGTGIFEITPTVDNLDELKISLEGDRNNLGTAYIFDTDTAANRRLGIVYWNDTTKAIGIILDAGSGVSNTSPFTMVAGDDIQMRFTYPVAGWSANAAMSEDFSGRDVYVEASDNDNDIITANTEDIPFKTKGTDTTGAWSNVGNTGANTNDAFTAPETGLYLVTGSIFHATAGTVLVTSYINGNQDKVLNEKTLDGSNERIPFSGLVQLNRGEVLTIRPNTTITLASSTVSHWIRITKLSSSQQIFGTETVAAIYANCTQNIPNTTNTIITFDDVIKDTHGAYNTSNGLFTAPYTGYYHVSANAAFNTTTGRYYLYISSPSSTVYGPRLTMDGVSIMNNVTGTVFLQRGQTISIGVYQSSGGTLALQDTLCDLSIIKV